MLVQTVAPNAVCEPIEFSAEILAVGCCFGSGGWGGGKTGRILTVTCTVTVGPLHSTRALIEIITHLSALITSLLFTTLLYSSPLSHTTQVRDRVHAVLIYTHLRYGTSHSSLYSYMYVRTCVLVHSYVPVHRVLCVYQVPGGSMCG